MIFGAFTDQAKQYTPPRNRTGASVGFTRSERLPTPGQKHTATSDQRNHRPANAGALKEVGTDDITFAIESLRRFPWNALATLRATVTTPEKNRIRELHEHRTPHFSEA